jgi:hypothetical protein
MAGRVKQARVMRSLEEPVVFSFLCSLLRWHLVHQGLLEWTDFEDCTYCSAITTSEACALEISSKTINHRLLCGTYRFYFL